MISDDQLYGYSIILLAAAPMAQQLAMAQIKWVVFFPIFAIPALTLLISIGHLSKSSPVLTYRRLAPIGAGIGWALTWQATEKLFAECLRGSQTLLYFIFSLRPTLNWAIECSAFSSEYCNDFTDKNISVLNEAHHYPDNFWPAQEFNRFVIRNNPESIHFPKVWEPNMWYLGPSDEEFYFTFPSIPLLMCHLTTWTIIYFILSRYSDRLGDILIKCFVLLPFAMYVTVAMGMTVSGLHFTNNTIQKELDDRKINDDPYDFWADLKGGFRTSILIVDYSTAFSGFIIFATSRLRSGVGHLSALFIVPIMMIVPAIQTILRAGCEGHIADIQPFYKIYASTDETISFDLLPVCFATSSLGSVWSAIYFGAQYLHTCLGPMIIITAFIYQSFVDDFPTVQNISNKFLLLICLAVLIPSFYLYMPLGTKVAALFRYTSQSSIVQIFSFILIFFVYGWQRVEQDILMTSPTSVNPSFFEYLIRPTSPIWTTAQFTIVPMMLCSKFVAVFDFLASGNDVTKHIEIGTQFLPLPSFAAHFIGYLILFLPFVILVVGGIFGVFDVCYRHKLPLADAFRPTVDWMAHASVNMSKPKPHSLAYGLFNSLNRIKYRTALTAVFIAETFFGFILVILFFMNALTMAGWTMSSMGNDYRGVMLFVCLVAHIFAMFEMRKCAEKEEGPSRLTVYIGVATMQTALLNAYLWVYASDHSWGIDIPPMLLIIANTWIRGFNIFVIIAIRANIIELQRPSRTREASEIYESDIHHDADADDNSPVIFDLAHP